MEHFAGCIDRVSGCEIAGWAADMAALGRSVTIEVCIGGKVLTTTVANEYRQDLAFLGFGTGWHGFQCTVPIGQVHNAVQAATVRIRGSDHHLAYQGKTLIPLDSSVFVEFMAGDIVNNCNLRCPFCVTDYSHKRPTDMMTEETFLSLLPFLHVVPEGGFWLSCLYEPTLHPQLNRFVSLIPSDQRKKVWFTTNLTRTLSSEQLTGWAESQIHHINVSLDTTDPELFAVLRKNGRYGVFERNLNTLAEVLHRHPDSPKLRFITVAFKSNMSEIPALMQRAHDQWRASDHEIRFAFNVGHISEEFRREHFMTQEDWSTLSDALAKIDAPHTVSYPPLTGYLENKTVSFNSFEFAPGPVPQSPPVLPRPLRLRYGPDGSLMIADMETLFRVNVRDLEDPVAFFRTRLSQA